MVNKEINQKRWKEKSRKTRMKWLKQKRRKKAWKGERGQKVFKGKNTENKAKKQENMRMDCLKKNQQRNYANAKKNYYF